jgi:hypothetical protein
VIEDQKSLVESEYWSDLDKIVLSDEEIHDRNADWICGFRKFSNGRCPHPRGTAGFALS